MIKDRTEKDNWQFVFLSADMDAIGDARSYGIRPDAALLFAKNAVGTTAAWASLSSEISDYRSAKKRKIGFDPDRKGTDDSQKKRSVTKK
jgi:hypothetical protein